MNLKGLSKKRRAIVMRHCMTVLKDPEASDARKDKIVRMLMPYLFTKKSGRAPKREAGKNLDGTPRGKKDKRKLAASEGPPKGSKWDGLLPSNEKFN